ncbi:MAG: RCC1 repeat- and reductase domain-containing protein [Planctomycetota bacterium]|nr:RCC1 repeat- and reductase domain-containing protein [Planctomycetota bacterium]
MKKLILVAVMSAFVTLSIACGGSEAVFSTWPMIDGGESHGVYLASDGSLKAWGYNYYGVLGDGTNTDSLVPVNVSTPTGMEKVVQLGVGRSHNVALCSDGAIWTWGENSDGELGDGSNDDRNIPVQVAMPAGMEDIIAIAAGQYHSLALSSDGTVWAWGYNNDGQLGDGTNDTSNVPVQVSLSGCMDTVVAIAAGGDHSLALCEDGEVWTWGWNPFGQLGDNSTASRNTPTSVHQPVGMNDVIGIASGYGHSMAICSDSSLWTWGWNFRGQLGNGSTTESLVPVEITIPSNEPIMLAGGNQHTLALTDNNTVWAWGDDVKYGQLGTTASSQETLPVAVSAPVGMVDVVAVGAGEYTSFAVCDDGSVWAWGRNNDGQLGDGSTDDRTTPVQIIAP